MSSLTTCIGVINLKSCTEVKEREPIKGHKFAFDICTEERVYHLASETEQERQEWLETLNTLLFVEPRRQVRTDSYERLRGINDDGSLADVSFGCSNPPQEHPIETSARRLSCLSREPLLFHVCRSNWETEFSRLLLQIYLHAQNSWEHCIHCCTSLCL